MYERSAASASSNSVPAKALPGSISAKKLRAVRSSRFSVAANMPMISRTSQWSLLASSAASTASTACGIARGPQQHDADLGLVEPQAQQRIVQLAKARAAPRTGRPRAMKLVGRRGCGVSGAPTVSSHTRLARSIVPRT